MGIEIAIYAGVLLVGLVILYGVLYAIYKSSMTSMLLIHLLPGFLIIGIAAFITGKYGVYNYTALALAIVSSLILLGINIIFLASRLITPLNRIIEGLSEIVEKVSSALQQITSSSRSLAESASKQAASVEETSSSLEEMSSMTRQNANNANEANTLVKNSQEIISKADASMGTLTESMMDISKASEETSKIIKTIDEIAFQTNLLALNAAVEAARAGEAGAGFSVVADEVRNLAMRAAEAAKNTSTLIEGTVKKIKDGEEVANKTNKAFGEVSSQSDKISELVAEIAAASRDQALGIEQLNLAVMDMDKSIQQNAADADSSATAADKLMHQVDRIKQLVNEMISVTGATAEKILREKDTYEEYEQYDRYDYFSQKEQPKWVEGRKEEQEPEEEEEEETEEENKKSEKQKRKPAAYSSREVRPEQIIPLDDDDFKDF
jgi:methyl-accepting chemotaxis protein